MLEISDRVWHLRMVRFMDQKYYPKDLCHYFWAIVFSGIGTMLWVTLGLLFIPFGYLVARGFMVSGENTLASKRRAEKEWNTHKTHIRQASMTGIPLGAVFSLTMLFWYLGLRLASDGWMGTATAVGIIGGGVTFLFCVAGVISYIHPPSRRKDETEKPKKEKGPNLFFEWVMAKKHRVCPLIKVVSSEEP